MGHFVSNALPHHLFPILNFFLLLYYYILYSIFYYYTIYSSPFSIFTYCVYCLPLLDSKFQEDKFEELKPRNKSGHSIIL